MNKLRLYVFKLRGFHEGNETYSLLAENDADAQKQLISAGLEGAVPLRYAYTPIVTKEGGGIGRADEGIRGYTFCPALGEFKTYAEAGSKAEALNQELRLSPAESWAIVASSLRLTGDEQ